MEMEERIHAAQDVEATTLGLAIVLLIAMRLSCYWQLDFQVAELVGQQGDNAVMMFLAEKLLSSLLCKLFNQSNKHPSTDTSLGSKCDSTG